MNSDKVIRRRQLLELIGVSPATQWRMEKAGVFPKRIRLGKGSVGWHLAEVEEWLRNRERVQPLEVERRTVRRAADRALLHGGNTHAADSRLPGGAGDR